MENQQNGGTMSFTRKEYFTRPYRIAEGSLASRDNVDNIRFVVWTAVAMIVFSVTIFFMPIATNHGLLANDDYSLARMLKIAWSHSAIGGTLAVLSTFIIPIYGVMEAEYGWRCLSIDDTKFANQMGRLKVVRYLTLSAGFFATAFVITLAQGEALSTDPGAILMLAAIFALCAQPIYVLTVGREALRSQLQAVPAESN